MASVTVALTGYETDPTFVRWTDDVSIGSIFDTSGQEQTLTLAFLASAANQFIPAGLVTISLVGTNDRFTAAFEATGRIIFTASDDETLEVMIANAI